MSKIVQMQAKKEIVPEKQVFHVGQAADLFVHTWRLVDFMRAQQRGQVHIAELFAEQDGEFLIDLPQKDTAKWLSRIAVAVYLGVVHEEFLVFTVPESTVRFIELHGEEINRQPSVERMTELMQEFLPSVTVTA